MKGLQVALAELEDLLRRLSGVKDVPVVGVPDQRAGELPRAYVVKAAVFSTLIGPDCGDAVLSLVETYYAGIRNVLCAFRCVVMD